MSIRPNFSTAAATILSQLASELGRSAMLATLPPSFSHSSTTFLSSSARPAASTTLPPATASTFADNAPNAPDAPVTIAVLPLMSNSDCGFFRKSSDMAASRNLGLRPALSLHRRDRDQDRTDLVTAVDDLAHLI